MDLRKVVCCHLLTCRLALDLLVDRSVAVVLEGDGEGDDGDGHAPPADKVAQVADHATAPRSLESVDK